MSAEKARKLEKRELQQQAQKRQVQVQVKKQPWITKKEKVLYSLVCSVVIACSTYVVSYASTMDSLNRDIQSIQKDISQQQVQNENLEYKVKELSNPDRILRIAEENGLEIQKSEVKQANSLSEE
ncbi:hypothetical protein N781_12730 [Pontibacillus halophilus JSM 076056 = DSM 19796]|uniref:Cell division protein FtsL n=1 Tax=Pontibacillus halophilus JSM 076056 = DSM 19796 TaxID=1385510 RepID=A0A0A5GPU0_9BACI|nr:cell division protein FtsL [Pontibacillus halophilus]KGX93268.1 hypothetical protein N781_12730 [Pontibacillus halophilus JSM 076056 = DSM 19796]